MWKGTISFGMVSIPVGLFTATESKDLSFRQLHEEDNSPIKLVKRCSADGQDLTPDEIVKGFEYSKDRYVIIEDEDFEKLPIPSKQIIELTAFIKTDEIDPVYYEKSYYVEPEDIGKKPFALLVKALDERKLIAIGKIAIRTKERLCALRPRDGLMVLETLFYSDEVRKPDAEAPDVKVSEAEMKIAYALIDMLQEPFEPAKYKDEYREAMLGVIEAKMEGHEFAMPAAPEAAKPSVDLMAALKASVEAAKKAKAAPAAEKVESEAAAEPSTNGKTPARRKKTPAGAK